MIDLSAGIGKQAFEKLQSESVIWFTTVASNGTPQPRPVWFIWENNKIVIYTEAASKKLMHLQNNPNVSLHFNMISPEDDFYVFIGTAKVDTSPVAAHEIKEYITKYRNAIKNMNMTPESFSKAYDVRIEITPRKLRGL